MHAICKRLALWAFVALSAIPFASYGAVINVTDNADYAFGTGPNNNNGIDPTGCTLRKAIQNSIDAAQTFNDCPAGDGNDTITFSNAATIQEGTIGAFPTISSNIILTGPKTINGNNSGLGNSEIFNVFGNSGVGKLTLTAITLTGAGNSAIRMTGDGSATLTAGGSAFNNNTTSACCGGAISGDGTIALSNVTFTSNTAPSSGAAGGAIHLTSTGFSTITDANFLNNSAADKGGAVYVSLNASILPTAQLIITNGIFTNNTSSGASSTLGGGAVYAHATGQAFVSLLNCSFISNKADGNDGRGGAIFNESHDAWPMIVDHGLFTLNTAKANANSMGGAIYSADNMVVRASSFIANDAGPGKGGAIAGNPPAPNGVPTPPTPGTVIANSTIQGNTATFGGGVYTYGQFGSQKELKLINVTIDGNTASTSGGGIYTENIGGGTAVTRIANTIVSNNSGQNCANTNPPGNSVNNIVGNLTFPGNTCPSDVPITSGDPKLNGPTINPPDILTLTMSLKAASAANGTGDNGTCAAFPVLNLDQRSLVAPIRPLGRPNCDIGAYESSRAPGYGSVPAPGSTITINTFSGVELTSDIVISETGDDDLTISSTVLSVSPQIFFTGPAAPFTIADGGGSQTMTLHCLFGSPVSTTQTFTISHNATGSPATYTVNCNVVDPLVITTVSPLASSTVGVPGYSQALAATGGTSPYNNWIVTTAPATFPPGLTLNPATGAITGMPTSAGVFNFTVQVSDSAAAPLSTTKAFQITINAAPVPPTITTATPLPKGVTSTPYLGVTIAAAGGTPPYTNWAVTAGLLPPGLALNPATGALTGTPTLAGLYGFSITVTDSTPLTDTKAFTMTVIDPPSITTATPLPTGEATIPYVGVTFAATAGTPPYGNWQVTSGALPTGLTLAPATGQLTGTPTVPGPYSFTIQTTDATPLNASKAFTMTINPLPTISNTTPLPGGTVSTLYTVNFAATGGTLPYTNWAVTAGSLPAGLLLNAGTGVLTGTPTVAAPNSFSITVTDSLGGTNTKAFTLLISAAPVPPTITTISPLPAGTAGTAYVGVTFAAAGGTPPYTNWAVTVGSLPPGLALNAGTGALTGTPTVAGPYSFSITVTDSTPLTDTKGFTLIVNPPSPTITTLTPLPTGTQGTAYVGVTFAATGGTPPYTNWAVTAGSLPPGLTLNPGSGALTGTPTLAGPYSFSITVTDSGPATATKAFTVTINPPGSPTVTTATPLPAGLAGTAYVGVTFAATAGTPPYTNWAVTAGTLPPGLTLNAGTGALTGTPTVAGPYSFSITVTDSTPLTGTKAFTLQVNALPTPTITTATPLPTGTQGAPYLGVTFAATGGTPPYTNWAVTAGSLPPGLALNAGSGALTGTPTAAGPYSFSITVTDSGPATATKAFTVTINPPGAPTITTATPLPAGTVSTAYVGVTFAATGGTPPYTNWAVTVGTLPPGLALNAGTGALTGTPTVAGPYSFTIQVTDSTPLTATKAFTLQVNALPTPTITTASPLPTGTQGTPYLGVTFAATGGTPPYTNWAVTAGSLPPGLALNAGSGALTGTPTTAGPYSFSITVTDSGPATATKAFTVTINPPGAPTITTASPLPTGAVGTPYVGVTFAATSGTPPYTNWAVTVGSLPPGLALDATTGALTGTPTVAGPYSFTIQVTDSTPVTATKAFTLAVTSCVAGTSPTGGGAMQACVTGGGATCALAAGSGQFIPVVGGAGSPPAGTAPAGILFPFGLFTFQLTGCTPGSTVTMTVTYPSAIPAGSVYYKYGPQPSLSTPSWYVLPATLSGNTAVFTITDGGLGDDDLLANGTIVDQGGPGVPGGPGPTATAGAIPTPTLSEWALMMLAMLVLLVGAGRVRRRRA